LPQIIKAINRTIEDALIDTDFGDVGLVPFDTKEVLKKEADGSVTSILRPSIKVQLEKGKSGKFNSCNKERNLTVRIYFFAKDRYKYKIDNLKMQDIIENAFLEDIKVTDTFYLPIVSEDGVESEVVDTVLQCSFDLYSLENIYNDSALEDMTELNLKLE